MRDTPPTTYALARIAALAAGALVILVALGLAFAWPWLQLSSSATDLERYSPLHDGAAALYTSEDANGKPLSWRSANVRVLPPQRALITNLHVSFRVALTRYFSATLQRSVSEDDLPELLSQRNALLYEAHNREMDPAGVVTETVSILLRDASGEYNFGLYDAARKNDLIYDPPLYTPAGLQAGSSWNINSTFASSVNIAGQYRVVRADDVAPYHDCIQLDATNVLSNSAGILNTLSTRNWYCAQTGLIASETLNPAAPNDKPLSVTRLVSGMADAQAAAAALPSLPVTDAAPPAYQANWQVAKAGQILLSNETGESTLPPTWIPSNPPLILAAANNGDLVAFNAGETDSPSIAWRFHAGSDIYGPPTFDATHGHLYFGASDRRLYALDARGLFLWSFSSADNIATQPAVQDDLVFFGSEDHSIYALDAQNGALRWKKATNGALVSSPALDADGHTLVIGSDDGSVYALDTASGEGHWTFETNGAVEAPIVISQSVAYVASRDGAVYAIDIISGELRWRSQFGDALRTAPAIAAGNVYVIDTGYYLRALDRQTGKLLWRSGAQYSGRPILLGEQVLAARADGRVDLLNADGTQQASWTTGEEGFAYGPATGGGNVWLSDDAANLWRIGPPGAQAQALVPAWTHQPLYDEPFSKGAFLVPPVIYKDQLALVDNNDVIYLLDPLTGATTRLGEVPAPSASPLVAPAISGDTLLTLAGDALYANHLPDGRALWAFNTGLDTYHPPATNADTAAVLAWQAGDTNTLTATLSVLNLADGSLRWQTEITNALGARAAGGAVINAGVVYLSTPPAAFDLQTGKLLWQRADIHAMGGPGLSPDGATLYVGIPLSNSSGGIVAIDTSSGAVRWQTLLEGDYLGIFEQPWADGTSVIIPSASGTHTAIALDAQTGNVRWRYQAAAQRFGTLGVSGGRVWLILMNGEVIGLDEGSGKPTARFNQLALDLQSVTGFAQQPVVTAGGARVIVVLDTRLIGLATEATTP
jgi:outer membrane protein assembly factor BamB